MDVIAQRLQDIWSSIVDLTSRLVIPDWGALIALIPVLIAGLVALFLLVTIRRWATAGPRRMRPARVPPKPPAGVHPPAPSFAPIFAALGAGLTFLGLVLGGWALVLGLAALVLTLLYWLREAMRDYGHVEPSATTLPAVAHEPPPGVHVPGPSFRPILVAGAASVVFFGLVFGGWLLLTGIVLLIGALLGWLRDARREYLYTVEADRTGHLRAGPDPRFPTGSVTVAGLIVVLAVLVQAGILPPSTTSAGSASPGPSGAPGASAAPAPSAAPSVPAGDVTITAKGFAFSPTDASVASGAAFTIAFVNDDAGVPHDIVIHDASGATVFSGEPLTGSAATIYQVPSLPPGTYPFVCSFHANMTGTITVK